MSGVERTRYPWNVRIAVAGVSFQGPGMYSEERANAIAAIVEADGAVESVEVFKQ